MFELRPRLPGEKVPTRIKFILHYRSGGTSICRLEDQGNGWLFGWYNSGSGAYEGDGMLQPGWIQAMASALEHIKRESPYVNDVLITEVHGEVVDP